jgi:hypothetical protein
MKTKIVKLFIALLSFVLIVPSCKREIDAPKQEHIKTYYRVGAIKGGDTTRTASAQAREQTVGLAMVEDNDLKMTLVAYSNGTYTVEVKNKQSCSVALDWGWEGLRIFDIDPNYNIVGPGDTKTYILRGEAKLGKIKLKSWGWCGNSSTLIMPITIAILPVTYLEFGAKYDEKSGIVNLNFLIDDPNEVFFIEKLVGTKWEIVYQFTCDKKTTSYNIPIFADEEK